MQSQSGRVPFYGKRYDSYIANQVEFPVSTRTIDGPSNTADDGRADWLFDCTWNMARVKKGFSVNIVPLPSIRKCRILWLLNPCSIYNPTSIISCIVKTILSAYTCMREFESDAILWSYASLISMTVLLKYIPGYPGSCKLRMPIRLHADSQDISYSKIICKSKIEIHKETCGVGRPWIKKCL